MAKGQVLPSDLKKEEWIKFSNNTYMFPQNFSDKDFYWEMKQHFRWGRDWIFSYEPCKPTIISINILEIDLTNEVLIDIFKRYNMEKIK
jgi:hypothetical protein